MQNRFPTRQVHLDFHTSPVIPGIGSKFSKENFQAALKTGNLDSITVFAKCHHGHCYFPTMVGTMHPELSFDLTGAMIDAAHEIGIRAPVYITLGWSDLDATEHPEWVSKNSDGSDRATPNYNAITGPDDPMGYVAWKVMCLNDGPYIKHVYALTEEICQRYPVLDGLFYDICFTGMGCACDSCKAGMAAMGLDPASKDDCKKYFIEKRISVMKKCGEILHKYHPDATLFFNGGANIDQPDFHPYATHYEMEDLPTAWGGYDKLPLRAKYFQKTGKPYVGMTGKFHLDWGEFGGFKTKEALKYEIATMAMYGAGASVGDHMHPDGEMELQTYRNIGYAYDYLEKIAPYCYNGTHITNLAIYLGEKPTAYEGLSKILLESQMDYNLVSGKDFDKYDTFIIPQGITMDDGTLAELHKYLSSGGKLLLIGDALVKNGAFQIDTGLAYLGDSEFDCDYIRCLEKHQTIPDAEMLCYHPGKLTQCVDAVVHAELLPPYFNRTFRHFCGHKNTPQDKAAKCYPAITQKGNILWMAHDLPAQYHEKGSLFHKYYFLHALNRIHNAKIQVSGLGAQGRVTMNKQPDQSRYCINMTYASPVKRGAAEVIEDILPVYDIAFVVETVETVKRVWLPMDGQELPFTQEEGSVRFTVPRLLCHNTVVMEY